MRPAVILEDNLHETEILIPDDVGDLDVFRRWAFSDAFPASGRIDYLQGTIEVDMTPEDLQSHGQPKVALTAYLSGVVTPANLGQIFVDSSRLTHPPVGLSCEPDIIYVSLDALRSGRIRFVTSSGERSGKLVEIEGSATLVVEVVSDSSVNKDLKRLPALYSAAGVEEFWLLDARKEPLYFQIHHLAQHDWVPAPVDADGFQESRVLRRRLRVRREPWALPGTWRYWVEEGG